MKIKIILKKKLYVSKFKMIKMNTNNYDFIIIGGGISGLYMANLLQKSNYSYILLEGLSAIGGRCKSIVFQGHILDIGGSWVHKTHTVL